MKQYRITTQDLNQSADDDCYLDPNDPIHELKALAGAADPLEKVADHFKRDYDIICFDEFFVSDIGAELDAAKSAGMATAIADRPGNVPGTSVYEHPMIRSFDDIIS